MSRFLPEILMVIAAPERRRWLGAPDRVKVGPRRGSVNRVSTRFFPDPG
jgi:hypothetical protein